MKRNMRIIKGLSLILLFFILVGVAASYSICKSGMTIEQSSSGVANALY